MRAWGTSAVPPTSAEVAGSDKHSTDDQPVRREWCAPPFVAATPKLDEGELRSKLLLGRIRRALGMRRQNWLQVFASFDQQGNGQLQENEFERAVTSMALGLSDQEIREVRVHLQGSGSCVPVDQFGKALHQILVEVSKAEEWGRSVLLDLAREAVKMPADSDTAGIGPGATVQIQGLHSAAGVKLNGCEGVVDRWDASTCRWFVRLTDGTCKSIRHEHLRLVRSAPDKGSVAGINHNFPDTSALYRVFCASGDTALLEQDFLAIVGRLMPLLDSTQKRRLLLLQPKSPEGRVDIPEVLAQLAVPLLGDQTIGVAGPGLLPHRMPTMPLGKPVPGPDFGAAPAGPSLQPRWGAASPTRAAVAQSPTRVPGVVPSPRGHVPPQSSGTIGGPGSGGGGSAPSSIGPARQRAEMALLRLAQRLLGRPGAPGPGLDALRLFALQVEEVRTEELLDAVSVLPLGISRAEVQSVFEFVRLFGGGPTGGALPHGGVLPFERLASAAKAAYDTGVPSEAAALERIDLSRLSAALQRVGSGRASPQEFRVTIMQAEPYLTHSQLEWLTMLTDKDGEGHLLPWSLLVRLGGTPPPLSQHGALPTLPCSTCRVAVAPNAPRLLVVSAILARIRDRLLCTGLQLSLERILGLFDVAPHGDREVSQNILVSLLSHLRLGISASEAHELVAYISGGRITGGEGNVQLASLYMALQRAGAPEAESSVNTLREFARQRLLGHGHAFSMVASSDYGEWLPEIEFRQCLASALADGVQSPGGAAEDEEDRMLLLAEKNAAGDVRWKTFVQHYAGLQEVEIDSDFERHWRTQASPKHVGGSRSDKVDPALSQQSWRSMKTAAQATRRMEQEALTQVTEPPSPRPRGFWRALCRWRRRCGRYGA
mmetsp:Transcript_5905/g.14625  ORF Transcript_5905/g.14625 Transcript_5905/m.14625 type:complete len:884 (+) Transcript_5905:1-2652(+)